MNKITTALVAVGVLALAPVGVNAMGDDDQPTLEDDLAAVAFAIANPDMAEYCREAEDMAFDLYLSDVFALGEAEIAAEMLTAWMVEMFEGGYESNLAWEAEEVLSDFFMECAGFPQL